MKKLLIPITAGVAFAALQLAPSHRSNPQIRAERTIEHNLAVPPEVARILDKSCRDCHSSATRWPWYSRIAPASWLVTSDVEKGREAMNLSEWSVRNGKTPLTAAGTLAAACEEVKAGIMPPPKYVLLHPESRLTPGDVYLLCGWTARESRHLAELRRRRSRQAQTAH